MRPCPDCLGDPGSSRARWCGRCGARLDDLEAAASHVVTRRRSRLRTVAVGAVAVLVLAAVVAVSGLPGNDGISDLELSLPPTGADDVADAEGPSSDSLGTRPTARAPLRGRGRAAARPPAQRREPPELSSPAWSASVPGWLNGSVVTPSGVLVRTTSRVALVGEDGGAWSEDEPVGPGVNGRPLVVDGAVVVGSPGGELKAFELRTGELRWSARQAPETRQAPVPLGAAGRTVAVWTPSRGLSGHALADGSATWRRALDVFEAPRTDGAGGLYAVVGRDLAKIDVATGTVHWTFGGSRTQRPSRLAVGGGHVVVFTGLDLVALDAATGRLAWRHEQRSPASGRPVVSGGVAAIPEARGHGTSLVALSVTSGVERWRVALPRFTTIAAVPAGFVAVTTGDAVRVIEAGRGEVITEVRPEDISVVGAVQGPDALVVAGTRMDGTWLYAYPVPGRGGPLPGTGPVNGVR